MQRNQATLFMTFSACTLFGLIYPVTGAARTKLVSPRLTEEVDTTRLVVLKGNTHPMARPEYDQGLAPDDLPMERMLLLLKRSPEQEIELQELLDAQQDPGSPSYHQWLTPEQFGEQFGASPEDIDLITEWLQSQGFSVAGVAKARNVIEFSGTAAQVGESFHTEIHKYLVDGEEHWANASDPQMPAALAPVVAGVASLNNFGSRHIGHSTPGVIDAGRPAESQPLLRNCLALGLGCKNYLAPGDFWTIYNETPLLTGSPKIDGAGVAIGVVGRTDVSATDVNSFRSNYIGSGHGGSFQQIINGPDPGSGGGPAENTLDSEWASATAPGSSVILVVSGTTAATDGAALSALYIVDNNLAAVVSMSYGVCEKALGAGGNFFFNGLWEQAAVQGITAVVSAGDSGAAGCDNPNTESTATMGLAVNGCASTPFNIAVGGTMFNEGSGTYWSPTESSTPGPHTSALSYIPEEVWNESRSNGGTGIWAGGGGVSSCVTFNSTAACVSGYPQPSWQANVYGTLTAAARNVPDVSFTAAGHDGYAIYLKGAQAFEDGTSASTPAFAGVMALVNQKAGGKQGLANPVLYKLAASEFGSSGNSSCISSNVTSGNTCVFYDITSGNNSVPGQTGYTAVPGYDQATGLGSVNVANLVNAWKTVKARASSKVTVQASPSSITTSGSTILTATVSATNSVLPTGIVTFDIDGLSVGMGTLTGSRTTATATLTLSGNAVPVGSDTVKAFYGGDSNLAGSVSSAVTLTVSAVAGNITTTAASSVTTGSATLQGSVNPQGAPGYVIFQWGIDPSIPNGGLTTQVPVTANTTTQSFSAAVTGLTSGVTYFFRIIFHNTSTNSYLYGDILGFKTLLPVATTKAATAVSTTTATLNGTVNPEGATGNAYFLFGTDPLLTNGVSQITNTPVTANTTTQTFVGYVNLLTPGTTYYYRIVFHNATNNSYQTGAVLSFKTLNVLALGSGHAVNGNLSASAPAGHCNFAAPGDLSLLDLSGQSAPTVVTFLLTSTAFDSYLCVLDASNNLLAQDDDSAGNLNATTTISLKPAKYYVEATSFSGTGSGAYTLSAVSATFTSPGTVSLGSRVVANLSSSAAGGVCLWNGNPADRWTFTLTAATTLTIDVSSWSFQTTLCLLNSANGTVDYDDHSGPASNARLIEQNLPLGRYYLEVSSHSSPFAGGVYALTSQLGLPPGKPISLSSSPMGRLLSTAADGVCLWNSNPADRWTFTLTAVTTLTIDVSSTSFETTLCLLNSANGTVDYDDHSGPASNARLIEQNLPLGTYYIEVSSHSSPFMGGPYTLSLQTGLPPGKPISLGQTLSGNLSSNAADGVCLWNSNPADRWTFTLTAITTLTIDVSSTSFQTTLCLLNSANGTVDYNDHSGPASNARLIEQNLASGTYYIEVSSHSSPFAGGLYTLSLKTGLPPGTPISLGQTLSGDLSSNAADGVCIWNGNPADRWQFSLGVTTTITIVASSTVFSPSVCLLNSTNQTLAFQGGGGSGTATLSSLSEGAGTYYIEVSSASSPFAGGAYTLALSSGSGASVIGAVVPTAPAPAAPLATSSGASRDAEDGKPPGRAKIR
jgi:subtilase family serine protease